MIIQRLFSDKRESEGKKFKTAGKALIGSGAVIGTSGHFLNSVGKRVKNAIHSEEFQRSIARGDVKYPSERAIEKLDTAIKGSGKQRNIGIGLAAVGAGSYLYGRNKDKKSEEKKGS